MKTAVMLGRRHSRHSQRNDLEAPIPAASRRVRFRVAQLFPAGGILAPRHQLYSLLLETYCVKLAAGFSTAFLNHGDSCACVEGVAVMTVLGWNRFGLVP
jgi:hypothetical protein